ncbi:fatty acid desaturase [Gymnodinialimonas sp. 2305UL16-5]|uniref:fatty acid desaturase n=1 Tax=Gymnodinialimonas mytili TaxID=3126503 RepID=UPI0030AF2F52
MTMQPGTHTDILRQVPPDTRRHLTTLRDGPGLRHLAGHFGLILALGGYVAAQAPLWGLALWPLGIALAFLFTLQHECTHRTPFKTPWLNEIMGHVTGLILMQPFLWFRAFHMAHHKYTNDPDNDPELAEGKPDTRRALIWHLLSLAYWISKARLLWRNAIGPEPASYITRRQSRLIRTEARAYLAAYAAITLVMVMVAPWLFYVWLLPLVLGFPVLRLYLLAEHDRCPHVTDMFANTRTTFTSCAIRALAWNMPYHAEHHAWPAVPYHRLPDLHAIAKPHLKEIANGYADFAKDSWKAAQTPRS